MKNKTKFCGSAEYIARLREITFKGRKMTDIKTFLGIWYWFYLLD